MLLTFSLLSKNCIILQTPTINNKQNWYAETTVKILCIGTDRSQQTVQTKIRLLLQKQSDQGLCCLPLHQLLLDALIDVTSNFTNFRTIMAVVCGVPSFRIFTVIHYILFVSVKRHHDRGSASRDKDLRDC